MRWIYEYLSSDHLRLDGYLEKAVAQPDAIDVPAYAEFRKGLLRHIGMEEKILFPAIARLKEGLKVEGFDKLRLDHGALVALLVPPPSRPIISTIRSILQAHNASEEGVGGVYAELDSLSEEETAKLIDQLKAFPEVPVLPHNQRDGILEITRRAVERAGHRPEF